MRQIKARIVVEGNVQGVGYRALIKQIARRMKIRGGVKNLDDGTVEIYCDTDKETFQKFKEAIEIKAKKPEDIFAINVEKIDVKFKGESGYISPEKELGLFELDYGEEAESAFEKANLERLEIGSLMLSGVGEKIDTVGENVVNVGEKVDKVGENVNVVGKNVITVGEKIDAGFSKTDSNFKGLDTKYDVVSKELKSMNKNISRVVLKLASKQKLQQHRYSLNRTSIVGDCMAVDLASIMLFTVFSL